MADSGIVLVIKIGQTLKCDFDEVVVAVEKKWVRCKKREESEVKKVWVGYEYYEKGVSASYGHTTLDIPDPIRTPKSSRVGLT